MKKIAVVGSLSYDLVMQVPRRPQKGETIIGTAFNTFVGGKGNNQALAAARNGAKVFMIGRVGADSFGEQIAEKLKESGADTRYLYRDTQTSTGIADILIDQDGDNSISIAPQANSKLSPQDIDNAKAALQECAYLLLQLEIPIETVTHAAKLGKELGLCVVLNPAPAPADGILSPELLENIDLIIPNQTEAELLTGVKVNDLVSAVDAGKTLQKKGLKQVIITMGEMGAMLLNESSTAHMSPAYEVNVKDTTAAGDAFCGGLLAALSRGESMESALNYACAAGALATTTLGAEPSLPSLEEVEKLVELRAQCSKT